MGGRPPRAVPGGGRAAYPMVGACDDDLMQRRRGTTPRAPHPAARSLADDLRHRTDEQLTTLLLARPDLARPTPADVVALAARATTRTSVQRALERLDRGQLQTVEALVVAAEPNRTGTAAVEDVAALLGGDPTEALDRLWSVGLVWWTSSGPHPVRAVTEVLGPHPGGLGLPAAEVSRSMPPTPLRSPTTFPPCSPRRRWQPEQSSTRSRGVPPSEPFRRRVRLIRVPRGWSRTGCVRRAGSGTSPSCARWGWPCVGVGCIANPRCRPLR